MLISVIATISHKAHAQSANDNIDMEIPNDRPVIAIEADELIRYEAAGQLISPYDKNKRTQGWLVGECIVVTPRHALVEKGNINKNLIGKQIEFKVGYQGKNKFKEIVKMTSLFCGSGNVDDQMSSEDYCVFKTNRSLAHKVEPIILQDADFHNAPISEETSVGFFPQASDQLDVLAKDINGHIVNEHTGTYNVRGAVISGAGLTRYNAQAKETYLIGMQVSDSFAVTAKQILDAGEKYEKKHKNGLSCD